MFGYVAKSGDADQSSRLPMPRFTLVPVIPLALAGGRIGATTRFEAGVLPSFGLPSSLPGPTD